MKLSYKKVFGVLTLSACILYTRTQRHEAYSRGDDLYVDGERYIEISGNDYLYQESKKEYAKRMIDVLFMKWKAIRNIIM